MYEDWEPDEARRFAVYSALATLRQEGYGIQVAGIERDWDARFTLGPNYPAEPEADHARDERDDEREEA